MFAALGKRQWQKLCRTHPHPAWCFYNITKGLGAFSLSKTSWVWFKTKYVPSQINLLCVTEPRGSKSSGSHGPAREEGTGTANRQRNRECAPPRTSMISSWARGNPWCQSCLLGSLLLQAGEGKSEDADNSRQSVVSPLQAEQLNNQTLSLLESPVCLQNQLSAKMTTEARFESAQPLSAIPHMDPTLSLHPLE